MVLASATRYGVAACVGFADVAMSFRNWFLEIIGLRPNILGRSPKGGWDKHAEGHSPSAKPTQAAEPFHTAQPATTTNGLIQAQFVLAKLRPWVNTHGVLCVTTR